MMPPSNDNPQAKRARIAESVSEAAADEYLAAMRAEDWPLVVQSFAAWARAAERWTAIGFGEGVERTKRPMSAIVWPSRGDSRRFRLSRSSLEAYSRKSELPK